MIPILNKMNTDWSSLAPGTPDTNAHILLEANNDTQPYYQAPCSVDQCIVWLYAALASPSCLSHLCLTGFTAALIMLSWCEPQERLRRSPRAGSESGLSPSPAPPSSVSQPQRAHCSGDRACHALTAMAAGGLHLSAPRCYCLTRTGRRPPLPPQDLFPRWWQSFPLLFLFFSTVQCSALFVSDLQSQPFHIIPLFHISLPLLLPSRKWCLPI